MNINGKTYIFKDIYDSIVTVPDCFVKHDNKIGKGHGEKKLYLGTKETMRDFFGDNGFIAECFILKQDLINYHQTLQNEYRNPSQEYFGKSQFLSLWDSRLNIIKSYPDIISFTIKEQEQIKGSRGYINSNDNAYELIRELSLPLVSYISIMKLIDEKGNNSFYWKLFVDFDKMSEKQPLVFTYGKGFKKDKLSSKKEENRQTEVKNARNGQGKYREKLLEECPFCPITMVNDERLLIASHIKPWAVCSDKEKVDHHNGYILTPLYDKLFDKGFITFTDDKKMIISNWLTPENCKRLKLKNDRFPRLPMDDKRKEYLKYHREYVFKGNW